MPLCLAVMAHASNPYPQQIGLLSVALAVLKLNLYTRLTLTAEILLPLAP